MTYKPAIAEGIGTFLFVFLGAGAVVASGGNLVAIAVAHGLAIAALVAATAGISGGHLNPAVTFAAWIAKKVSYKLAIQYILFQLVGGILAALLLAAVLPGAAGALGDGGLGAHALGKGVAAWQGLIIEIVLTLALVGVVFGAAMDPRGVGHVAPLAIGFIVLVDHLIGVPLTGASMNPARSLGPALAAGAWADHWVYWVGPLVGGGLAALLYTKVFQQK
jgi:MIP family channel proteins